MAFGFGFNKQKVLSAAEKFVQQGKLQNAIAEYEKIIKADPKDLTVANTVGDLYARLGENEKAIDCFKSVGDAYATQGFTVKAIAMYKKITKIKTSLEGVLKLAELYTLQGLFNDARAQYLQVAEEFLKNGELDQAVRIFQKILEMDPENVPMRVRLAEVYIRLGKKTEAWQIFSGAAESLRTRGQLNAAEEILQRMTSLDPGNSYALLLRGRNALESGETDSAIKYLEKVADIDSHPDGMRDLLKVYLQAGRIPDAVTLANKLLTVHNDCEAIFSVCDAMMQSGQFLEALALYQEHAERLLSANSAKILDSLHGMIGHVRDNIAALNTILELFNRAGENTHCNEVMELLAHASVQSGDLTRARDLYQRLAAAEPGNPLHHQNFEQVVAMMGGRSSSRLITAEEGAVMIDELEATSPVVDQHYPDAVAVAVRAALTDADLFVSYNMPGKAVVPLLSALPQAPHDVRLNQRLAALHTRAERFPEAARCCRTLQSVYSEAGYPEEALRYGELATKYEERTSPGTKEASAEPVRASSVPARARKPVDEIPAFSVEPAPPEAIAAEPEFVSSAPEVAAEGNAAEIDLSEEWEGALVEEALPVAAESKASRLASKPAASDSSIKETVEEIRFYLAHFMPDQARTMMAKLEQMTQNAALLANIRAEIKAAEAEAGAQAQEPELARVEPELVEDVVAPEQTEEAEVPTAAAPVFSGPVSAAPVLPHADSGTLDEFVSDLESALGDGFLPETAAEEAPTPVEAQPAVAEAELVSQAQQGASVLGEFVSDLETSLGEGFLAEAPAPEPEPGPAPVTPSIDEPEPEFSEPAVAKTMPAMAARAAAVAAPASTPVPVAAAAAVQPLEAPPFQPGKVRKVASAASAVAPAAAPGKFSAAGVDLAEMFGELKQDLEEEVTATDEDPETHYNLGVSFREMGLLDEAIGELQKVCQAVDRGDPFPNVMQTYTWLAQCFLDKGVPEAAVRWYEKALKLTTLDDDTRMALHYELASSYEAADDKASALKYFMEVYGSNIDYRDVAERIKALKS